MAEDEGGMIWENSTETCILSSLKQIASPRWMHETNARGWCTGMTQRDGMGREVGGGSGWGTHVNPWLIQVIVWQKPLQYCKVISLQLKKLKKLKKKEGILGKPYSCLLSGRSFMSNSLHPIDWNSPVFPVLCHLLELVQTHVHWVGDAIQPSRPLSSPSPALNLWESHSY